MRSRRSAASASSIPSSIPSTVGATWPSATPDGPTADPLPLPTVIPTDGERFDDESTADLGPRPGPPMRRRGPGGGVAGERRHRIRVQEGRGRREGAGDPAAAGLPALPVLDPAAPDEGPSPRRSRDHRALLPGLRAP